MKTEIWLVRHGETEWNALGKFQGCCDIQLSERGKTQAELLNSRFKNKFDCIYTSPLKRAVQTANIIANGSDIKPIVENDMREINFGEWEGMTIKEIQEKYERELYAWRNDDENAYLVGGDDKSLKLASIRARNAILKIAKKEQGKRIIIVAHGGIIKAGIIGIFNWKMTMYHNMILGNTSVSEIMFGDSMRPILLTLNDTSHVPENCKMPYYV